MNSSERESVRELLMTQGVSRPRRATTSDSTEEVILVDEEAISRLDISAVTEALMTVLPHRKVLLTADSPLWQTEPV